MEYLLSVRQHVRDQLQNTSGIKAVLAGKPSREFYIRYLINVYQYAQHSPKVIGLAATRCTSSHPQLARYLLHHADEEMGHDLWALADLRDLGVNEAEVRASYPEPACTSMIGVTYYTAGYANPIALFGWLYVLEAMGDDLGSLAAQRIDEGLKLQGKALRFLAGHGVNDVAHTADLTNHISKYVVDPVDRSDINHVANVVSDLYVRMFEEIAAQSQS